MDSRVSASAYRPMGKASECNRVSVCIDLWCGNDHPSAVLPFDGVKSARVFDRLSHRGENVAAGLAVCPPGGSPLAAYTTETITPKFHDALVAWQKKNF